MRIESVTAHAFGPFTRQTLDLAPGFTVVWGPNEAGKSSWHMALYAGLCGMRRGRGRARPFDQKFRNRSRPWDGHEWKVSATVHLGDGRRVELAHDLDGLVNCSARDAVLGRDYSNEIMYDGAPDGSRWLGLDRRSFLAVACVQQADTLGVLDDPAILQEYLQRAATSTGGDTTVAEALECLERFQSENIGQDRANSQRPLRRALNHLAATHQALDRARLDHDEYLDLLTRARDLDAAATAAETRLRAARAAAVDQQARDAERRWAQIRRLLAEAPAETPAGREADDQMALQVAGTLEVWRNLPAPPALTGDSAATIEAALAALPAPPAGDTEPHPSVLEARDTWEDVRRQADWLAAARPAGATSPDTGGASAADLRAWVDALDTPVPAIDPALQERIRQAQAKQQTAAGSGPPQPLLFGAGGGLLALGLIALVLGLTVPGIILMLIGAGLGVWGFIASGSNRRLQALEELRDAEAALGSQQHAVAASEQRQAVARQQTAARELPADPARLRDLAAALDEAAATSRQVADWEQRQAVLHRLRGIAEEALRTVLTARGAAITGDLSAALDAYLSACRERRDQAQAAAGRALLEARLRERRDLERTAAEVTRRRSEVVQSLTALATQCRVSGETPADLAQGLANWLTVRNAEQGRRDENRRAWTELQTLLDGRTPADWEAEATTLRVQADALRQALPPGSNVPAGDGAHPARIAELEEQAAAAARAHHEIRGQIEERRRTLVHVAEAEEACTLAEAEVDRLHDLDRMLDLTRGFLHRAQESVHRSIAPVLIAAIKEWLPRVTAGRYRDVSIDPETLKIQVRGEGGPWRDATLLSHGTREQIYLLLRFAMAKHLTKPGESCPLILDDITVQCDAERTGALLAMLQALSRDHQVILFSQEDDVRQWAERHLQEPQDRLVRLDGSLVLV